MEGRLPWEIASSPGLPREYNDVAVNNIDCASRVANALFDGNGIKGKKPYRAYLLNRRYWVVLAEAKPHPVVAVLDKADGHARMYEVMK